MNKTPERIIVMVQKEKIDRKSVRVVDINGCTEDAHSWFYDYFLSPSENREMLERLVYNGTKTDHSISPELEGYLKNREAICKKDDFSPFTKIIDTIKNSSLPPVTVYVLRRVINEEIYETYPFE